MLCDIGLFDPEKMNQGIFGFRRYENSSLNYTGIDMHEGEDIGGWDTVLRREEYNTLYANQQATLSLQSAILAALDDEPEEKQPVVKKPVVSTPPKPATTITQRYGVPQPSKPVGTPSTVQVAVQKPKEEIKVPDVKVGDKVKHKTFGEGTISFMDKAQKKIRVQFHVGEKMFLYPDAFVNGHLSV